MAIDDPSNRQTQPPADRVQRLERTEIVIPGAARLSPRTRSRLEPRERLIEAATTLFCQRGINAVGVDAIVEEAATAKTTLYKLFGSKDALVEEVLKAEGNAWRDWFMASVSACGPDPHDQLSGIFPVLTGWFRQRRFYGCPFINAVGEHDKNSDRMRELALSHKRQVLDFIRALCERANVPDPDRLTHEIGLLIDGAIVAAMITKDPAIGDFARDAFERLLSAEGTLSPAPRGPRA